MSSERLITLKGIRSKIREDDIALLDQVISYQSEPSAGYYNCFPGESSVPSSIIPFKNILFCKPIEEDLYSVTYTVEKGKSVEIQQLNISIDNQLPVSDRKFSSWASVINEKAYADSQVSPSILVLVNPKGGQGKAKKIYQEEIAPVLHAANAVVEVKETQYTTHAKDIARDLDISKYDIICCCSGDGIPHEVMNGFFLRPDKIQAFNKIAITQLPCGSGNALSLSTHGTSDASLATARMLKASRTKLDLMAVTQLNNEGGETTSLSFLSQCYGAVADADIGTDHLRWMGPVRFDLGILYKLLTKSTYPCDLYVKYVTQEKDDLLKFFNKSLDDAKLKSITDVVEDNFELSGPKLNNSPPSDWIQVSDDITSKLSIFYVGKMPMVSNDAQFFPAALPNDGTMDLVLIDFNSSVAEIAKALLVVDKGQHINSDSVAHHKISAYRLVPKLSDISNHYISIDGEDFPVKTTQVEIIPGILTSLLDKGLYVGTSFSD